jgi:LysM repeat protein
MPTNSGKMTTGPDQPNQEGMPNLPKSGSGSDARVRLSQNALVHTVQMGETLSQIAELYEVEVKELISANRLTGQSVLYPGLRLIIPAYSQEDEELQEQKDIHLVQSGESLFGIAQLYGMTVSKLQQLNSLGDNAILFPGTTLHLVERVVEQIEEAPLKFLRLPPTTCLVHGYHRVRFGDQLSRIAAFHGVSTQSLLSANNLGWNALIHEGQKLIVPISHGPYDCPNLVKLDPAAFHNAQIYFETAKEMQLSEFSVVVALCLEMQRSGLVPEFGGAAASKTLLLGLKQVDVIESMNVKQVITALGYENLAEGSALWEPSAWAWLREVGSKQI